MPGSIIIIGEGTGRVAKNFETVYSVSGFQVTNELAETATVHYVATSGNEDGSNIGITTNSTVILGAGWLSGVP